MIKLFSLKQEKAEADKAAGSGSAEKKIAPGLIRMQKGAHPCLQPPDTWRALSSLKPWRSAPVWTRRTASPARGGSA